MQLYAYEGINRVNNHLPKLIQKKWKRQRNPEQKQQNYTACTILTRNKLIFKLKSKLAVLSLFKPLFLHNPSFKCLQHCQMPGISV